MRSASLLVLALLLTGCASTPTPDDGTVHVVASTNVYGSIAEAIGGDLITVTSLVDSAARDPHSFEASAHDQLAITKADLVIENGGGYDDFVDILLDAAGSTAEIVNAAETAGLADGANEHLWYSLGDMRLVSGGIATTLSEIDPANAAQYDANLQAFWAELDTVIAPLGGLGDGKTVAITEPVPLYLLSDAGFENVTPDAFSEAIEEGTDVAPSTLQDTLDAVTGVALLAYNSQTASPETEKLRLAAEAAGVPVVEFTETLPDGETYVSWMTANVAALR